MTSQAVAHEHGFGATQRQDAWWVGPLLTAILLLSFLVYSTWAAFQGAHYWVDGTNYLSPFYSPEFWGTSPHAILGIAPSWWPTWFPSFSAALLILGAPAGFRLTCYYYRKAYYRSIWLDPVACSVGEARKSYWGENSLPLILWNAHRYFLYLAIIFVFILLYDGIISFIFPVNADGSTFHWLINPATGAVDPTVKPHGHHFGIGLGSIIILINPLLIAGYTFGCHSLRHLVGGKKDAFSCTSGGYARFKAWSLVSALNHHHPLWAMISLVWVAFTDIYIRLVSLGIWHDPRIMF